MPSRPRKQGYTRLDEVVGTILGIVVVLTLMVAFASAMNF